MNLTPDERAEFYDLARVHAPESCCGMSMTGERRRRLADLTEQAFDDFTAENGYAPDPDKDLRDIKSRIRRNKDAGVYGSIILTTILLAILSACIQVLVKWLIQKWIERNKKTEH